MLGEKEGSGGQPEGNMGGWRTTSAAWVVGAALAMSVAAQGQGAGAAKRDGAIALRTRYVEWVIGPDGRNVRFAVRRTGRDLLASAGSPAFIVRVGAETRLPTSFRREGSVGVVDFGDVRAEIDMRETPDAVVMQVRAVRGPAEELTFGQAALKLAMDGSDPLEFSGLARNDRTNIPELPGATTLFRAIAYRRLGFEGASAAFVCAPAAGLRKALQRVAAASPELPQSPIGGPWAMDSPANRRSYLFNFNGLNERGSKPWIDLAHALGAGQIDFHGGTSFRFGDFVPNPETYPDGMADLKRTVDALHRAGLQAGLHTYSFFIDKRSRYVTPKPDPRLASARSFTLAGPISAADGTITVAESTEGVNAITGFFVNNSATLRIGDELVTFREASRTPPWRFTGCVRGAYGTHASAHEAGTRADHLKELFGLFAPDAETDLFTEIIENTARTYNECGFDMIYLDALDGSFIHAGPEWAWRYSARFVYDLVRRLKRPAILEMSTFHHHLWCVRSRMGAWDAPHRGYKEFVDMHRIVNRDCARMYLPSHLGWWAVSGWGSLQQARTYPDDLEYLLCKALADDAGVSFVYGFAPETFAGSPGAQRYAAMIRRYEALRREGALPKAIRERLGRAGEEYTLEEGRPGQRAFVRVEYETHTGEGSAFSAHFGNSRAEQPLSVRIEPLMRESAEAPGRSTLLDASDARALSKPTACDGVRLDAETVTVAGPKPAGAPATALRLRASNARRERRGAWGMVERVFDAHRNLRDCGLGVWVHGDGKGAVLNFQLRNAPNLSPAVAERYLVVDFTGWRWCALIEPESARLSAYSWPYAGQRSEWEANPGLAFTTAYKTYHPVIDLGQVAAISVWVNETPAGGSTEILIGDIVSLPLTPSSISEPSITLNDRTLAFPVTLTAGQYVEYVPGGGNRGGTASVYGPDNALVRKVDLRAIAPTLPSGGADLQVQCRTADGAAPRVAVTVITRGERLRF